MQQDADIGLPNAQLCLGLCIEQGTGVLQSFKEAFRDYKLASAQGLVGAQFLLGMLLASGKGEEQSTEQALKYYHLAAA